jgi:hypothetical protein
MSSSRLVTPSRISRLNALRLRLTSGQERREIAVDFQRHGEPDPAATIRTTQPAMVQWRAVVAWPVSPSAR